MKVTRFVVQNENKDDGSANGGSVKTITPEEFASIKESVAKLEAKNKELLQEKAEARKTAQQAAEDVAKKNGDVAALEKSWQEKYNALATENSTKLSSYEATINNMTVGATARSMAAELALQGSAEVLLPHIERRLKVEIVDGATTIRVLDTSGKPSALSVDELKAEILANKAFAPLLVGSKASGSGDVGKKGASTGKVMKRSDFDALSPREQDAFVSDGGRPVDN